MVLNMINKDMNVIIDTTFLKYMTVQEIQQLASIDAYLIDVRCKNVHSKFLKKENKKEKIGLLVQPKRMFNIAMILKRMIAKSKKSTNDSMTLAHQIKD
jgi:hypothetical protein